jgi:hypothetical protein
MTGPRRLCHTVFWRHLYQKNIGVTRAVSEGLKRAKAGLVPCYVGLLCRMRCILMQHGVLFATGGLCIQ